MKYQYRVFDSMRDIILKEIYDDPKKAQEYCDLVNNSLAAKWAQQTDRYEVVEEEIERD